mmetsp:Transcript_12727/g.19097  ORF Transcript_12727/g.19097 Transcript_12727/m.19097 type:complete len:222 (-) Transcript_12727:2075-2740(-)|eukprot:CAMPEP_0116005396 /NCGR_PEP_ID=MMETSP0321-20121206/1143_1 /TAXON_ID=163516 /ORGANISM="Leptocylindrus danicus var. danicus, Strain B650" /LENGTH=221 /DNA_ID=CAMNT_0003473821 /DNA_START=36 /DNA_END=701 /DNA_ORIENTATION=+
MSSSSYSRSTKSTRSNRLFGRGATTSTSSSPNTNGSVSTASPSPRQPLQEKLLSATKNENNGGERKRNNDNDNIGSISPRRDEESDFTVRKSNLYNHRRIKEEEESSSLSSLSMGHAASKNARYYQALMPMMPRATIEAMESVPSMEEPAIIEASSQQDMLPPFTITKRSDSADWVQSGGGDGRALMDFDPTLFKQDTSSEEQSDEDAVRCCILCCCFSKR